MARGVFVQGFLSGGLCLGGFCLGVFVLEPAVPKKSHKCVRFSVFRGISDHASCYEKYSRSVSSSLWDTLDGQGKLS